MLVYVGAFANQHSNTGYQLLTAGATINFVVAITFMRQRSGPPTAAAILIFYLFYFSLYYLN